MDFDGSGTMPSTVNHSSAGDVISTHGHGDPSVLKRQLGASPSTAAIAKPASPSST